MSHDIQAGVARLSMVCILYFTVGRLKPSPRITVTLKDFGQRPINGASILVDRTRSKQLPYQPKQAVFLHILLGHDFFIGKARLWLAERAKARGSHGGAPETGFNLEP